MGLQGRSDPQVLPTSQSAPEGHTVPPRTRPGKLHVTNWGLLSSHGVIQPP